MMISPLGPSFASCLIPPPKRDPRPAAIITSAVFFIVLYFLSRPQNAGNLISYAYVCFY